MSDGIPLLAPALADDTQGYPLDYFERIRLLEDGSFWFRARNILIQQAVGRNLSGEASFLEVGCGTGYVLEGLHDRFPAMELSGSELSSQGLAHASARLPGVDLIQMDARAIPFQSHFDGIGAFDVIEHIEEDEAVLIQMRKALKLGGYLFLTVPQHPFLWSEVDVFAHHVRRYRRSDLTEKLERVGFGLVRAESFVSLLFPFLILARARGRRGAGSSEAELSLPLWLDRGFDWVMGLERGLIRRGVSFPFGGSLLVVAQRLEGET